MTCIENLHCNYPMPLFNINSPSSRCCRPLPKFPPCSGWLPHLRVALPRLRNHFAVLCFRQNLSIQGDFASLSRPVSRCIIVTSALQGDHMEPSVIDSLLHFFNCRWMMHSVIASCMRRLQIKTFTRFFGIISMIPCKCLARFDASALSHKL